MTTSPPSPAPYGYEPPKILALLRKTLAIPREEYSTDFTLLFDDDSITDNAYGDGLIFLSCIIGGVLFLWGFALLVLKLNGNAVGCASGAAFAPETESFKQYNEADCSEYSETDSRDLSFQEEHDGHFPSANEEERYTEEIDDSVSFHSSLPSEDDGVFSIQSRSVEESVSSLPARPSRREKRTQMAFFFFGVATLVCIPLAHVYVFLPLRDSAKASSDYTEDTREVIDEVETSMKAITMGTENVFSIIQKLPLTEKEVCPQVESVEIEKILGFPIEEMIQVYVKDYGLIRQQTSKDVDDIGSILGIFEDASDLIETVARETENYVWILPGLLVGIFAVTSIALFGVFLSQKRDSNRRLQRFLSYVILPFLLVTSIVCWALAISAATGAAVASDVCLSGSSDGTPAQSIQSLLATRSIEPESSLHRFITAYSTGCQGDDPTEILTVLESDLLEVVETIWQYLSAVDAIGRSTLRGLCGEGNKITPFLVDFRDLAKQLTSVSRSLDSASSSLACTRLNEIYDAAVNNSLCDDVAGSSATGFLMFLALGMTTMAMISLRASWRHHIDEDKIYDESEVAENMIVDEHEEYLAYISKYKSEWEEYGGFETAIAEQQTLPEGSMESVPGSASDSQISYGTHSNGSSVSEVQDTMIAVVTAPGEKETFDPYNSDSRSLSTSNSEDISFLSLSGTPQTSPSCEKEPPVVPPPLLVRKTSAVPDDDVGLPQPLLPHSDHYASQTDETLEGVHQQVAEDKRAIEHEHATAKRKLSGSDDEAENNLINTAGEKIDLKAPPLKYLGLRSSSVIQTSSPGQVKFSLSSESSPTFVQEKVDQFSKKAATKPLTPNRGNSKKMKDLASRFDL